jgi:hypothetical protein
MDNRRDRHGGRTEKRGGDRRLARDQMPADLADRQLARLSPLTHFFGIHRRQSALLAELGNRSRSLQKIGDSISGITHLK